ncbi:hypothetical protein [Microbacterium sp.]|uniref:hypothetical protein n=1 Tax=Microbacterium sp. TaxID=51671 RepID=UPI002811D75A|nr:hypothetical protein [Microbacterium sp.]
MSTDQASTDPVPGEGETIEDGVLYEEQVQPEYGILGFTLRELLIVSVWALAFAASFFPLGAGAGPVWAQGLAWVLSAGVPAVAVFLLVLRRFSPDGIRRVGSLGIDQFASVAFSVAAVIWAQTLWNAIAATVAFGEYLVGWVTVFETVAFFGLVALTVAAPLIPRLRDDFQGRLETLAHRNANPVRPVIARPRPERSAADAPATPASSDDDATRDAGGAVSGDTASDDTADETIGQRESDTSPSAGAAVDPDATSVIEAVPQPGASDAERTAVMDAAFETYPDAASTRVDDDVPREDDAPTAVHDKRSDAEPTADGDGHVTTEDLREIFSFGADTGELEQAEPAPGDAERLPAGEHVSGGDTGTARTVDSAPEYSRRSRFETSEQDGGDVAPEPGPFWILAGSERDVHDEHGRPLFRIGPQAWALVIEDRGGAYVVRHDDGRIGYLHDVTNITKG